MLEVNNNYNISNQFDQWMKLEQPGFKMVSIIQTNIIETWLIVKLDEKTCSSQITKVVTKDQ